MGERLRKVAEEGAALRIDLFGVQADVVGKRHEPLHQLRGLVQPALPCVGVGEPEGAGEEGAFLAAETIVAAVAAYEGPVAKRPCDGIDRRDEPRRPWLVVPGEDAEQQRRIELLAAGGLDVALDALRV